MDTKKIYLKSKKFWSVIVIILVLVSLYFIFDKPSKINEGDLVIDSFKDLATTTDDMKADTDQNTDKEPDYIIEQVPVGSSGLTSDQPNLSRQVNFDPNTNFQPEVKTLITSKVLELQSMLKNDQYNFSAWIDLGIYYKMAGDFDGAIDVWVYATVLSPTDFVSLGNLGNLYAYNLKNLAQADIYYRRAIANDRTQVYLYIQLAEAYRDVAGDTNRAVAVVNEGLSANPNNPTLLNLKENLQK